MRRAAGSIFLSACLFLTLLPCANAGPIIALGVAAPEKEEAVPAPERALANALRTAVTEALAKILGWRRFEGSLPLVAGPILDDPAPYVGGFQIKSKTEGEKLVYVLATVDINLPALKEALTKLGLGQTTRLNLLPLLSYGPESEPYAWWVDLEATPPPCQTLEALLTRLSDLGVNVLPIPHAAPTLAERFPTAQQVVTLGLHFEADLVLVGRILESETADGVMVQAGCQIIDTASGQVVAGPIQLGGPLPAPPASEVTPTTALMTEYPPPPSGLEEPAPEELAEQRPPASQEPSQTSALMTEQPLTGPQELSPPGPEAGEAAPKASPPPVEVLPALPPREAGSRLAVLLTDGLKASGWVLTAKPTLIQIQVEGIKRYLDLKFFLQALARFPDQIQDVKQHSIQAGKAVFSAKLLTTAQDLADLLVSQDYPTFFVSVVQVAAQTIQIKLIPK